VYCSGGASAATAAACATAWLLLLLLALVEGARSNVSSSCDFFCYSIVVYDFNYFFPKNAEP
jgi:hypothetical protein